MNKIAKKWFEGSYNEQLARMQASIKGIDFNGVTAEYKRLGGTL